VLEHRRESFVETQYLINVLRQLEGFVSQLGQLKYAETLDHNSSIGAHVRHCLDHSQCLLQGLKTGLLSYDHRQRDTELETNSLLARETLQRQINEFETWGLLNSSEVPITVQLQTSTEPVLFSETRSTLAREILFVASHTVHHMALIKALSVQKLPASLPRQFGVALSTQTHQKEYSANEAAT